MSKFIALITTEYGRGRVVALTSRLNNTRTGNTNVLPEFTRRTLEWASTRGPSDIIETCYVQVTGPDAIIPDIDRMNKIALERKNIDDLSDPVSLDGFDCLVISGFGNNLSPLIQQNILSFVENGKGLIAMDFTDTGSIELFETVSPIVVTDISAPIEDGPIIWEDSGLEHFIFQPEFSLMPIAVINTIPFSSVGSGWDILAVLDTEADNEVDEQNEDLDDLLFSASSDFPIRGKAFVGYYGSLYRKGIIDLET